MRRLLTIGVLLFASLGLGVGTAIAVGEPVVRGSWTQLRTTLPIGGSPDLQQTQGQALPVENGLLGPIAFSAVRYLPGAAGARLTLALTGAGSTDAPVVWACPATRPWAAGDRQVWDQRPTFDCARHAVGTAKSGQVSWEIGAWGAGALDVVLVPDPSSTSAFSVTFDAPTADSFIVQTSSPGGPLPDAAPPAQLPEPVPPLAVPVLPRVAGPGLVTPPVSTAPAPVFAAQTAGSPVTAGPVVAKPSADHSWAGAGLLALLTFLVMLRTALPLRPLAAPSSLLHRPEEGTS